MIGKKTLLVVFLGFFIAGCAAGPPVREGLKENLKVPAGTIEGNRFTGVRYPFKVSAPPNWKMSTEFPEFLKSMGYGEPTRFDKEVTELYLFNPATQSSVQIDFTPADRYTVFSQSLIEHLTAMGDSHFVEDLEEEYGKEIKVQISPPEPVKLKGVQYAAKASGTYRVKGQDREQGWIYAFTEPYQIFILYQIINKQGSSDRQDLKTIIDTFEVVSKK